MTPVAAPELALIPHLASHQGDDLIVRSPVDGAELARLRVDTVDEVDAKIANAVKAFEVWRAVPGPQRGELVRQFGEKLREHKEDLARLVTLECGKILEEGRGEVQEMIDICDFAVGLSRQLYGLTIASERPNHTMEENWLPLGPVGVISAFNFPVAVWAWNAALALVCGDPCLWKPSEKTPLTALACQNLFEETCRAFGAPEHLNQVVVGLAEQGNRLVEDRRVPLISATGSCRMGSIVGPKVAARFGRSLLELGGNNAIIVAPSADLEVAIPSILFGSVGTAGQRCTSTRRVIVHRSLFDKVFETLAKAYRQIGESKVGNPLEAGTLVGPLIDQAAFEGMEAALARVRPEALEVVGGGRALAPEVRVNCVSPGWIDVSARRGRASRTASACARRDIRCASSSPTSRRCARSWAGFRGGSRSARAACAPARSPSRHRRRRPPPPRRRRSGRSPPGRRAGAAPPGSWCAPAGPWRSSGRTPRSCAGSRPCRRGRPSS